MTLPFEAKAERKAENILVNYDYCLVTPLKVLNEWGDCQPLEPVKCTTIEEIKALYEDNYDVQIETPDGCNY